MKDLMCNISLREFGEEMKYYASPTILQILSSKQRQRRIRFVRAKQRSDTKKRSGNVTEI